MPNPGIISDQFDAMKRNLRQHVLCSGAIFGGGGGHGG
jgi:hypothetical protein